VLLLSVSLLSVWLRGLFARLMAESLRWQGHPSLLLLLLGWLRHSAAAVTARTVACGCWIQQQQQQK
jgi:hypothetical protein